MKDRYRETETTLVVLIGLIFLAVFVFLYIRLMVPSAAMGNMRIDARATDEETKGSEEDHLYSRSIFFAGLDDMSIRTGSTIALENLEQNGDFLMKYKIYEGDELLFETQLIPAGKHVSWDPSEMLCVGKHTVTFSEEPYAELNGGMIPLTCGKNVVNIEIVK